MIRKLAAVLLTVMLLFCSAAANADIISDYALNWYEIFVYSYADSDGDGIGDIRGIISKLDYIEDMGYNGIWLMPVMPSPSYHKYDITDYLNVDPQYGTLDDFRDLTADCHERNIRLIIDLPINHTSTQHPWFQAACEAIRSGNTDDSCVSYYNWSQDNQSWVQLEDTSWYYEESFSGGGMPDLNLDNDAVREELRQIFSFWLNDIGVDGFRLDAVTSYYPAKDQSIEFLSWIKQQCEAIKPGSFLVGECWKGLTEITEYYQSGVDAFFLFPASQAEGWITKTMLSRKPAAAFVKYFSQMRDALSGMLVAPFIGNHDTGRAIGSLQARSLPDRAKFAETVLTLFGGAAFTYYGEEIGMVGSGDDPNKRTAMYWSDSEMTQNPPGVTKSEYAYPSVEAQQADPDSLLNYCRSLNHLKLRWPEISRGQTTIISSDNFTLLMERTWNQSSILLAVNFSASEPQTIELGAGYTLADQLNVSSEQAVLEDGSISLPAYSLAILTPASDAGSN